MHKISATILTCNNAFLGQAVLAAQKGGADLVHADIIDGRYADNFSFGPKTISDLKEIVDIPVEVHFELYDPLLYVDMFADAGADMITIQPDSCACPVRVMKQIKSHGIKAGFGLTPKSSLEDLEMIAHHMDYLILMSVEPGFGGQKFEEGTYAKLKKTKALLAEWGLDIPVFIDGGVGKQTAPKLLECGADVLITGSCVFSRNDITEQEIIEGIQYYKNL